MHLFLHAGTHKTATTTFQTLCDANREKLAQAGVFYPRQPGWTQHSFLAWALQAREDDKLLRWLRGYRAAAQAAGCAQVLLSGEDFETCLVDTHQAALFQRLAIRAGFTPPRWIVVQRDPRDYLASIYAEKSKYGIVLNMDVLLRITAATGFFSLSTARYNYRFVLDVPKFAALFREDTAIDLEVLPFESFLAGFPGACLLARWLPSETIAELATEARALGRQNSRLSPGVVERLYACAFLGTKIETDYARSHDGLFRHLIKRRLQNRAAAEAAHLDRFVQKLRHED